MRLISLIAGLIAFSTQAHAQFSACQTQLNQSIDKILADGPVRIVQTIHADGKPYSEITTLFVPPRDTQVDMRTLLTGDDLRKYKAMLEAAAKANPGLVPGPVSMNTSMVHIGDDVYIDGKKDADLMKLNEYRKTESAKELSELRKYADASTYYAVACAPRRIDFEIDEYLPRLLEQVEEKIIRPDQVDPERKKIRLQEDAATKRSTKPLRANLELDPQGRPMRLTREEETPDTAALEMAKKMFPGLEMPNFKSLNSVTIFSYDKTIRITAPR